MCRLLRLLTIRLPGRRFVFAGDSAYGTREVARFVRRHRSRLTLVSKLHPDANLYDPPAPYGGRGRPPAKGPRRAKPSAASGPAAARERLTVRWYGGGKRDVSVASEAAHWYKSGKGLVPVRWAAVRDLTGTHRDGFLYATDPALAPAEVIGYYCGRWNIETTFQELHGPPGPEDDAGAVREDGHAGRPVPVRPLLRGGLAVRRDARGGPFRTGRVAGQGDDDLLRCAGVRPPADVVEGVLPRAGCGAGIAELPEQVRELLLTTLAPAA